MAFEKINPQHDLHVADFDLHRVFSKRSMFRSVFDEPTTYRDDTRHNRDDLNTRCNFDLP